MTTTGGSTAGGDERSRGRLAEWRRFWRRSAPADQRDPPRQGDEERPNAQTSARCDPGCSTDDTDYA